MTSELAYLLLGIAGTVILILFTIIGYFLRIIHNDAKKAVEETGKNKGRIELVEQQLNNDVKRIEQTTQLELRNLATTVQDLSISVKKLVDLQLDNHSKS